ncbi:hypothetical protein EVAR_80119_1 [Eumeta japonica]|uniref:Uncharacterized protein n=1 Tax=Eumeta variegata TaxID=151549 RepID=A0A4C1UE89_EUMVA|nr:hypothetical protein EVAR_80119_1 [Eumeta japonica]
MNDLGTVLGEQSRVSQEQISKLTIRCIAFIFPPDDNPIYRKDPKTSVPRGQDLIVGGRWDDTDLLSGEIHIPARSHGGGHGFHLYR